VETPDRVVDYDPGWPATFEDIRRRVEPALADVAPVVEHVGSTAVPGLAGKPIVDLDVVVVDAERVPIAIERLSALGYEHQGDLGVAAREAFKPPADGPYHHLYVVVDGSRPHRDHVDLRDYLREHPDEAQRYADRKREIAHLLLTDREAYTRGKSDLVEDLLSRARRPKGRVNRSSRRGDSNP
jgi:GrpB-like predicted nucleotidyltransferase (UPF0157 family)